MKKMNKTLRFLCSALVLILLASALFSCTKKPEAAETETGTDTEAPETATDLTVNGVALSEYTIVHARKQATGAEKAADRLNKRLEALCGTVLNKDIKSQADRYEILIGVDGGDADIAAAYESSEGAMLGASGKKIVLLGSNGKLLCDVVDAFLSKVKADGEKQSISVEGNEFFKVTTLPLNVMTYNILFNMEKEGREADCLERMCETILEYDVDVLGTQEDGPDHADFFVKNMKIYSVYKGDVDEGNHIYWKTDKFNLIKKGYCFLSKTPYVKSKFEGSNHFRTMTYVILEDKETGKQFFFVNTHADYQATEDVRVKQLDVLTSQIKKLNVDSLPVVLLGDFNTFTTRSGSAILNFLGDNPNMALTSKVAEDTGDMGSTLVNDGFVSRGEYIFDYILVDTYGVDTKYYSVIDNIKNGKYPSDHLPVFAQVEIY